MDTHVHKGACTRLKKPGGIGIPVLEVFGSAVGHIALGIVGAADGAVRHHALNDIEVIAHIMYGGADELHAHFFGRFDLQRHELNCGSCGLLGDEMLAVGQRCHVDLMMRLNGGSIDNDLHLGAFFQQLMDGGVMIGDAEGLAGSNGAFRNNVRRSNAFCVGFLCYIWKILSGCKGTAADNCDFPDFLCHGIVLHMDKNRRNQPVIPR